MTKIIQKRASSGMPAPQVSPKRLRKDTKDSRACYCKVEGCFHGPFADSSGLSKHMRVKHPNVKVQHGGQNKSLSPKAKSQSGRGRPRKNAAPEKSLAQDTLEQAMLRGDDKAVMRFYDAQMLHKLQPEPMVTDEEELAHQQQFLADDVSEAIDYFQSDATHPFVLLGESTQEIMLRASQLQQQSSHEDTFDGLQEIPMSEIPRQELAVVVSSSSGSSVQPRQMSSCAASMWGGSCVSGLTLLQQAYAMSQTHSSFTTITELSNVKSPQPLSDPPVDKAEVAPSVEADEFVEVPIDVAGYLASATSSYVDPSGYVASDGFSN